jgi:flagellum-specific peptidoglycan hydrolase FlgJ
MRSGNSCPRWVSSPEVDYTPSPDEIISRIHNGEAVIVSSPGYNHYFVITDFNPQTNMFYVGNTGNVWRDQSRNSDWLSFGQIMPQASIYFAPGQVSDALSDTNGTQQQPQSTPQNIHDASSAAPQATQDGRIASTSVYGDDASRKQAYVTAMYPLATQYEQQTGIPAELFLAIGGSESNFGNAPGYSLFGIMAGQGEQRAGVGTSDGNLKGYNSLDESMNDFAQLMLSRRYRPAVDAYHSGQVDLRGMVAMIRDAGYDSPNDPNYQRWPDLVMGALGQVRGYY